MSGVIARFKRMQNRRKSKAVLGLVAEEEGLYSQLVSGR